MLQSNNTLIHVEDYEHSYPYDWRTKLPIIIRASKQWFIDTEAIRQKAEVSYWLRLLLLYSVVVKVLFPDFALHGGSAKHFRFW